MVANQSQELKSDVLNCQLFRAKGRSHSRELDDTSPRSTLNKRPAKLRRPVEKTGDLSIEDAELLLVFFVPL